MITSKKIIIILLSSLFILAILATFFLLHQKKPAKNISHLPASQNKSLEDFYKQSQNIIAQKITPTTTASFLAVGDIMLSRNVAAQIKKANNINLPFEKMSDILKSTNFNFGNLESPVGNIIGGHSLVFGSPKENVQNLKNYNFDLVNLANNHGLDQGINGLNATINFLDDIGIKHIGVGDNTNKAWQPAVMEANGIKICFVGASYASINDNGKSKNDFIARIEDIDSLRSTLYSLRSSCDFTIVIMHAGTEYTRKPNEAQIAFAHAAIDAGADMVIGAHPHWIQTIETYKTKYIFYSLGNFIFDQMWSQDTREGLVLKITLSKNVGKGLDPSLQEKNKTVTQATGLQIIDAKEATGQNQLQQTNNNSNEQASPLQNSKIANLYDLQGPRQNAQLDSVELIPVIIDNYSTPRPATAEEAKNILEKIGENESFIK